MPVTISLSEILDVLISQTETSCAFVNRETGEILACTEEGIRMAEAHQDEAAPQWMQEQLPKIRKALQGDPWPELPSKFDIHEWEIMGRFADQQPREKVGQELHAAIRGAGAFRRFREAPSCFRIADEWYSFRDRQCEDVAREWLAENGLHFH